MKLTLVLFCLALCGCEVRLQYDSKPKAKTIQAISDNEGNLWVEISEKQALATPFSTKEHLRNVIEVDTGDPKHPVKQFFVIAAEATLQDNSGTPTKTPHGTTVAH